MTNNELIHHMADRIVTLNQELSDARAACAIAKMELGCMQDDLEETTQAYDNFKMRIKRLTGLEQCPFCGHIENVKQNEESGLYTCSHCYGS